MGGQDSASISFSVWAGLQYFGQLRDLYGNDKAGTIAAAYLNRVYFNPNDITTSTEISKQLGEVEIEKESSSLSRGRGGATRSNSKPIAY